MKNSRTPRHHPLRTSQAIGLLAMLLLAFVPQLLPAQEPGTDIPTDTGSDVGDEAAERRAADTIPIVTHIVTIETTLGSILLELYGKDAPRTVENFIGLCEEGFYDSLLIHRVHPGFLIQSGCPKTRDSTLYEEWGTGGISIYGGEFADEIDMRTPSARRGYIRGTLAMGNSGPNTNTSQFFILLSDLSEWMPQVYTIFGRASDMTTVDSIATANLLITEESADYASRPYPPIRILSTAVTVE